MGAVNQSESGRGGQAPLTLCTVGGGIFNLGLSGTHSQTHSHTVCLYERRSGSSAPNTLTDLVGATDFGRLLCHLSRRRSAGREN